MDRLPEAQRMPFKTTAEMIFEKGEAKGLEKGFEKGIEQGIEQGIEKGFEQGLALNKIESVKAMLAKGCNWTFIFDVTHLDQADYEALLLKHGQ